MSRSVSNLFNLKFKNLGYIIGFSAIFIIFISNLMISHQSFSIAYPVVSRVSFNEFGKFSIMPMQDTHRDFGPSSITTNPNNEEWKNRLCENTNQAGINIRIPFICDPADKIGQNENTNQQDENTNQQDENTNQQNENTNQLGQDISNKVHKKVDNLKQKIDDSIFGNNESDNSQSNNIQSHSENDNKNGKGNNKNGNDDGNNQQENSEQQLSDEQGEGKVKSEFDDDDTNENSGNPRNTNDGNNANNGKNQDNNNDDGIGNTGLGLGLNFDKKLGKVDEKIDDLKNNLDLGQQENKDNQKNNNDQGNNDDTLGINGLPTNILNIQTNLDKKIEKLKDKFENDEDNQRLIDQRNEFDNDEEDDTKESDGGDDGSGKDYDGYGFKGDDDDGNGNGHENGEENFNFAAAGDFGCSTNTQNTIENMQSKDPEIVLTLGDLSYHSTADCWFDMMSPVKDKLMLTLGYHDVEDGQAKMNQYMNSFALEKPFYSYDYNKVHFLVMSAKSVYYKGSEQYNFVVDDLKKASENENVNWIVVSSYGPPYTSPSEHTAFKELREVYHPIFEKYGVDLVLGGHNHNYQRTYPLTYNPDDSGEPKVISTASGEYDGQQGGIVFAIVGTGGVNLYPFTGQAPFVEKQFANKFGYLNIDISNDNPHSKLTGTFYDNKGGQILDQFTINKQLKNKNSEIVSS
jgi:Calcineurin-like phosphoesterase